MSEVRPSLVAQRRWMAHRRDENAKPADIRIGVTASFTAEPLEGFLGSALLDSGVVAEFAFAEYNQIREVCFDPAGALGPIDFLCVLWRIEDMFARAVGRAVDGDGAAIGDISDAATELGNAVADAARNSSCSFVVSTPPFPRPVGADLDDSVIGIRLGRAHAAAVDAFLSAVGDAPVVWADLNAWQLAVGIERSHDVVKAMVYRQPFTTDFWHVLGRRLGEIIARQSQPTPKCIVLDCDNTLWGGVIGEDGIGGIALGSAFPGSGFQEFQKVLKSLKDRGVLLAISSKNNPKEVDDVFAQHDDMVLRADDIAVWRVNWGPKSQSLREIAAEINIGLDSLVMIDDSNYEIAEIANSVPEVRRLQVPEETGLLPDLIASSGLFRNMKVSAEDLARTDMIRQESQRRHASTAMSREEFLGSLDLQVDYIEVGDNHVGRVAQLTNKTNQFNVTTIRRTEADVRALVASDGHLVRAIRVADKFGDYGLVGVAIVDTAGPVWTLDTFLMSCRVLSRGIETAFLGSLVAEAREHGAQSLRARYVATPKNALVADLFPRHGFTESPSDSGEYEAELGDVTPAPDYVKVSRAR